MCDTSLFSSAIGPTIARYLALKQALGRKYDLERRVLTNIDAFLCATDADLTAESFSAWCRTRQHLASGVRRNCMRVVRNLCLYRRRTVPFCFVPDQSQFPPLHQPVQPHIFTEAEITRLLDAADRLRPGNRSPLRPENFRLALVLLYTTGLRRGELVRLAVGDYDPIEGTLLIRESKFHKSRLLPLSCDGRREVQGYLKTRRERRLPISVDSPLLWIRKRSEGPYTGKGLGSTIRELFRTTGIRTAAGRWPRIHDFRHTFAVQALLRWYRVGEDVQAKLPLLAIYMGHVSIVSTEYYLHFVDMLTACAADRFAERFGALITPPGSEGDGS